MTKPPAFDTVAAAASRRRPRSPDKARLRKDLRALQLLMYECHDALDGVERLRESTGAAPADAAPEPPRKLKRPRPGPASDKDTPGAGAYSPKFAATRPSSRAAGFAPPPSAPPRPAEEPAGGGMLSPGALARAERSTKRCAARTVIAKAATPPRPAKRAPGPEPEPDPTYDPNYAVVEKRVKGFAFGAGYQPPEPDSDDECAACEADCWLECECVCHECPPEEPPERPEQPDVEMEMEAPVTGGHTFATAPRLAPAAPADGPDFAPPERLDALRPAARAPGFGTAPRDAEERRRARELAEAEFEGPPTLLEPNLDAVRPVAPAAKIYPPEPKQPRRRGKPVRPEPGAAAYNPNFEATRPEAPAAKIAPLATKVAKKKKQDEDRAAVGAYNPSDADQLVRQRVTGPVMPACRRCAQIPCVCPPGAAEAKARALEEYELKERRAKARRYAEAEPDLGFAKFKPRAGTAVVYRPPTKSTAKNRHALLALARARRQARTVGYHDVQFEPVEARVPGGAIVPEPTQPKRPQVDEADWTEAQVHGDWDARDPRKSVVILPEAKLAPRAARLAALRRAAEEARDAQWLDAQMHGSWDGDGEAAADLGGPGRESVHVARKGHTKVVAFGELERGADPLGPGRYDAAPLPEAPGVPAFGQRPGRAELAGPFGEPPEASARELEGATLDIDPLQAEALVRPAPPGFSFARAARDGDDEGGDEGGEAMLEPNYEFGKERPDRGVVDFGRMPGRPEPAPEAADDGNVLDLDVDRSVFDRRVPGARFSNLPRWEDGPDPELLPPEPAESPKRDLVERRRPALVDMSRQRGRFSGSLERDAPGEDRPLELDVEAARRALEPRHRQSTLVDMAKQTERMRESVAEPEGYHDAVYEPKPVDDHRTHVRMDRMGPRFEEKEPSDEGRVLDLDERADKPRPRLVGGVAMGKGESRWDADERARRRAERERPADSLAAKELPAFAPADKGPQVSMGAQRGRDEDPADRGRVDTSHLAYSPRPVERRVPGGPAMDKARGREEKQRLDEAQLKGFDLDPDRGRARKVKTGAGFAKQAPRPQPKEGPASEGDVLILSPRAPAPSRVGGVVGMRGPVDRKVPPRSPDRPNSPMADLAAAAEKLGPRPKGLGFGRVSSTRPRARDSPPAEGDLLMLSLSPGAARKKKTGGVVGMRGPVERKVPPRSPDRPRSPLLDLDRAHNALRKRPGGGPAMDKVAGRPDPRFQSPPREGDTVQLGQDLDGALKRNVKGGASWGAPPGGASRGGSAQARSIQSRREARQARKKEEAAEAKQPRRRTRREAKQRKK